jgi:hypothetical protein
VITIPENTRLEQLYKQERIQMLGISLMQSIHKQFALAKSIVRLLCRLIYRTCTQKIRVLPDFFVLGPPRSGTSSLDYYIAQHPSYVRPFMKELGYTVDPEAQKAPHGQFNQSIYQYLPAGLRSPLMWAVQGLYYHNGANGYRKLFPLTSAMKRTKQRHGKAITADYTVFGLYSSAATGRSSSRFCGTPSIFCSHTTH